MELSIQLLKVSMYGLGGQIRMQVQRWMNLLPLLITLQKAHLYIKLRRLIVGGGQTPYYWPTKGSLVFAGYSPASAKVDAEAFRYDLGTQIFTVTNYVQPKDIAKAKDLMWFDVTDKSYNQNVSENQGIPVTFNHALSWLTFKFNLKESTTAEMWTITDVTLKGIEDKATFTAVKGGAYTWSEATLFNSGEIDVFTEAESYLVKYVDGGTVLPGTDVGEEDAVVKEKAVLVIPQSCAQTDASIVITYDMKTYVGNGVLTEQTVELPLTGTQITGNMWEPGKHYIYTITFGANEILIAPTVEDWTDVPVEVPVR